MTKLPQPLTLDQIAEAAKADKRKDRPSWISLAISLRALEETSRSPLDPTGARWSDRVASAASIGSNQIVKIARCWRFLEELAASGAEIDPPDSYSSLPVEVVDIVARYITLDRDAAIALLRSRPTYDSARTKYAEAQAASKRTHQRGQHVGQLLQHNFELVCLAIFKARERFWAGVAEDAEPETLTAAIEQRLKRRGSYTTTDAVYYHGPNHFTAMQCRDFSSAASARSYPAFIRDIALKASFYLRFWVFTTTGDIADDLVRDLDLLDIQNVGVVTLPAFDPDSIGAHHVIRDIKGGPLPDRRHLLLGKPAQ
jgi:hypothetical protein